MYAGMTPLQVAIQSPRRHSESDFFDFFVEESVIVRLLLEAGANPSTLGRYGNPMWECCSVYSIIELIKHDINLNLRDSGGNTILHHWIDMVSYCHKIIDKETFFVDVVNLLIASGLDLTARSKNGFTPILTAAILIKLDVGEPTGSCLPTLLSILDLLLVNDNIDATDKIDAMELAGAQLLLALEPEKASHYWKKAMDLRKKEEIRKIPLQTNGQVVEWQTHQQLEDVIQDKSVHWIQATLAGLRICANRDFGGIGEFFMHIPFYYTFEESYVCHCQEKHPRETEQKKHSLFVIEPTLTQIADLSFVVLEVLLRFDRREPDLCRHKKTMIEELIPKLPYLSSLDNPLPNVESESIKTSLKLVRELILVSDPDGPLRYCPHRAYFPFELGYKFFELLAGVSDLRLHEDIWKFLSESTREKYGIPLAGMLAEACGKKDWKTLRILLHLQADSNATASENGPLHVVANQMMIGNDCQLSINAKCEMIKTSLQLIVGRGNRPLHLVAEQQEHPMVLNGELEREQVSLEMECTLAHVLFDYGADPYRKNYEGKTAVDIWTETNCGVEGIQSPKWKNRPYWCRNSVPKLSCLATKTIHTNGIPHTRPGVLPVNLLHFVALH